MNSVRQLVAHKKISYRILIDVPLIPEHMILHTENRIQKCQGAPYLSLLIDCLIRRHDTSKRNNPDHKIRFQEMTPARLSILCRKVNVKLLKPSHEYVHHLEADYSIDHQLFLYFNRGKFNVAWQGRDDPIAAKRKKA